MGGHDEGDVGHLAELSATRDNRNASVVRAARAWYLKSSIVARNPESIMDSESLRNRV